MDGSQGRQYTGYRVLRFASILGWFVFHMRNYAYVAHRHMALECVDPCQTYTHIIEHRVYTTRRVVVHDFHGFVKTKVFTCPN